MIYTSRVITVRKGVSLIDEPVILYRGDYEVEVKFTIVNSKFNFLYRNSLIEIDQASYAQLVILDPHGGNIFSTVNKCTEGVVSFVISEEMINELSEVGLYSFQIRLFDQAQESRATIPPVEFGIEIREPIASEDTTEVIDAAMVGYSIARATKVTEEPVGDTFDSNGNYIQTEWTIGDRVTPDKLNKIEEGIGGMFAKAETEHYNINRLITSNYNTLDSVKANNTDLAAFNERVNTVETELDMSNNMFSTKINEVNELIDTVNDRIYDEDWYAPEHSILGTILGQDGIPSEYNSANYESFYNWMLNPLMQANPNYISKQDLGKDQSGMYNIYRYNFTPTNYEKTLVLFSCVHGNEYTSFFGLCRFLKEVCDNQNDPNLAYIRNKVRLVVVPIVNPWGFVNGKRQNINTVDINRNFDYRWEDYLSEKGQLGGVYYKGTAPFSEKESRICRDLCASIPNLNGIIDFHTLTTVQAEKVLYYPRFQDNAISALSNVVKKFKYGENRAIFSTSSVPTLTNYACWTHGIYGCNPEWNNYCYETDGLRDSINMTKWVEWAGNIILAIAKNAPNPKMTLAGPFVKTLHYSPDPTLVEEDENRMSSKGYRIPNSSAKEYNTMEISKYDFSIDQQYIIMVDGWVKISAEDKISAEEDPIVYLQPMLYQRYSPEQRYGTVAAERRFESIINIKEGQEYFIPVKAVLQGFHTNYNDEESTRAETIHFRLRSYSNVTNAAYISGYNVVISGIPSDKGKSVVISKVTETELIEEFPLRIPQEDLDD